MRLVAQVLITTSEEERIAKLGVAFRKFLQDWFVMVVRGVRFSPGVSRELALALLEHAAMALIATSDAAEREPDAETANRCVAAAKAAFDVMSREVLS